jgi:transposase InsO family protein
MTLEQSIQGYRLQVLAEAARIGNVSAVCQQFGISRTVFYEWRRVFRQYGRDALLPKPQGRPRGRRSILPPEVDSRVIAVALAWPTRGPGWFSAELRKQELALAPTTVWRLLHRRGLGTRRERLARLEQHAAARAGLVTEAERRRQGRTRHVQADQPGALVSLDSFYVGRLKGVGKIWQITACDVACSYGFAQLVLGEITATAVATFMETVVRPTYRRAGWPLQRVLTDRGKEFKGAFGAWCDRRTVRHTRTKPRHAWTNGFVERLQGTILHEHWRVAFRREFFTSCAQLQRSLTGFLDFYNERRPHSGYRLRGQTPSTLFWGAVRRSA